MGFGTTAVNTGPRNGACVLLEKKYEQRNIKVGVSSLHLVDRIRNSCYSWYWMFVGTRYIIVQKIFKKLA